MSEHTTHIGAEERVYATEVQVDIEQHALIGICPFHLERPEEVKTSNNVNGKARKATIGSMLTCTLQSSDREKQILMGTRAINTRVSTLATQ